MGYIEQLERRINQKIREIKNKKITPKESNISVLFNALKDKDEVSYEQLIGKYKRTLTQL